MLLATEFWRRHMLK